MIKASRYTQYYPQNQPAVQGNMVNQSDIDTHINNSTHYLNKNVLQNFNQVDSTTSLYSQYPDQSSTGSSSSSMSSTTSVSYNVPINKIDTSVPPNLFQYKYTQDIFRPPRRCLDIEKSFEPSHKTNSLQNDNPHTTMLAPVQLLQNQLGSKFGAINSEGNRVSRSNLACPVSQSNSKVNEGLVSIKLATRSPRCGGNEASLSNSVNSLSLLENNYNKTKEIKCQPAKFCRCSVPVLKINKTECNIYIRNSMMLDNSQSFILNGDAVQNEAKNKISNMLGSNPNRELNEKSIQRRLDEIVSAHKIKSKYQRYYEREKYIRSGGFSDIYEGRCLTNNCQVILKFIPKQKTKNWIVVQGLKFPSEVLLHKAVSDLPGVLNFYDYFEEEDSWVIVIERIPRCCDLFDYMERMRHGHLSETEARNFFRQLLLVNIELSRRGVVHRDIKSENILYNLDKGQLVLIDFGASAIYQNKPYTDFHGTRQFRPPEYIQCAKYNAASSTVWTLGILLYDMVVGKLPFELDGDILNHQIIFKNPISVQLHKLIHRCLNKNPANRPTIEELLKDPWVTNINNYGTINKCHISSPIVNNHMCYPISKRQSIIDESSHVDQTYCMEQQ